MLGSIIERLAQSIIINCLSPSSPIPLVSLHMSVIMGDPSILTTETSIGIQKTSIVGQKNIR